MRARVCVAQAGAGRQLLPVRLTFGPHFKAVGDLGAAQGTVARLLQQLKLPTASQV